MPSISISSFTQYYKSDISTKSYTGSGTATNQTSAETIAKGNAKSAAAAGGGSVTISNGGSSSSDKNFGVTLSTSSGTASVTASGYSGGSLWQAKATCTGKSTGTAYQLKLGFILPESITSDIIDTASITINYSTSYDSGNYSFALYAPKSGSNQTNYQKPSASNIIQAKDTFSITGGTTSITRNIKSALQQCINNGQYWLTLGRNSDTVSSSQRIYVSSVTINYTLTFTNNTAPNNVSSSVAIQKPTGTATISWSGAEAGTNVNITGYTVYWKTGEDPTTSSYTDSADVITTETSGSYTFTVPDNRGVTYYFGVVAKSDVEGYDSEISESIATVKVNSLPNSPIVTSDKPRVKSTGQTVTFTVTAGTDPDTSQTLSTYWATALDGTKTLVSQGTYTTGTITSAVTYYFWTYDGLEYSTYTNKAITVNTPPAITTMDMSAIATFTPTISSRPFVKNIQINAPVVTKDAAATLTYEWNFITGAVDGTPTTEQSVFGSATSYTNVDVTTCGVGFNNSYKLRLTITDDIGESATAVSANIFCIPAAPTITIYNQKANSNVSTANNAYFGRYIRIAYSGYGSPATYNNGLTKELQYSTTDDFAVYNTIPLTGAEYTDVDLNSLQRDIGYRFRVQYTCNSISTLTSTQTRTRAHDITPQNITATPVSGTSVKPYSQNTFSVSFTNQPLEFANSLNVATSYVGIYTTTLEYSTRSLAMTSSGSDSQGTITSTWTLNDKKTSDWITLINGSSSTIAPNAVTTVTLKIVAQNSFGETFTGILSYPLDFVEGISDNGTAVLQIKTGTNSWATIPDSYRTDSINTRYPTFYTQTLRINYSGLKTKANQDVNIYFMDGTTELGRTTITSADWTAPTATGNYIYELNGSKYIEYTLPNNTGADGILKDYSVKIVLVSSGTNQIISSDTTNNLGTTALHRIAQSAINLVLTSSAESSGSFNVGWSCTDFGASVSGTKYSNGYASISLQLQWSATPAGTYADLGTAASLSNVGTSSVTSSGILSGSTSSINYDIVYFGVKMVVGLKFTAISNATPTGTSTYTFFFLNRQVLYRKVPNLAYGKNFFIMNGSAPASGITNQILELHATDTRNIIYIGDIVNNKYATITLGNDIVFDGIKLDGGSWS